MLRQQSSSTKSKRSNGIHRVIQETGKSLMRRWLGPGFTPGNPAKLADPRAPSTSPSSAAFTHSTASTGRASVEPSPSVSRRFHSSNSLEIPRTKYSANQRRQPAETKVADRSAWEAEPEDASRSGTNARRCDAIQWILKGSRGQKRSSADRDCCSGHTYFSRPGFRQLSILKARGCVN